MTKKPTVYVVRNMSTGVVHTVMPTHFALRDPQYRVLGTVEELEAEEAAAAKKKAAAAKKAPSKRTKTTKSSSSVKKDE